MTQHAAQSAPSRSVLSAKTPRAGARPAPDSDGKLLDGVAAQDALVALFDEFADEEPRSGAEASCDRCQGSQAACNRAVTSSVPRAGRGR